jgi:hypothetical protein
MLIARQLMKQKRDTEPVLNPTTSTSSEADPVFALIDTHKKACSAHLAALQLQNRIEKARGSVTANWISEGPCRAENEAFAGLVSSVTTTLSGLQAKLAYLRELAEDDEWGWIFDEREGTALGLIESFYGSIRNVLP